MVTIVDSNFLFALKSVKDKYYERALEIMAQINEDSGQVLTNYLVIDETFTLAVSRTNADLTLLEKIYELTWGQDRFFNIVQLRPEDYRDIYSILKKYCTPKRLLSYVDASLIYLYQKGKANTIISFDSHFDGILNRLY